MKVVNIELPVNVRGITVLPLADLHIGENACDLGLIKALIEKIKNTENCYTILNGDIVDNALRASIGDVYSQEANPQDQLDRAIDLFEPIKDKILAITNGNHEERTYKDCGIDLMALFSKALNLEDRYANEGVYLFINFNLKDPSERHGARRIVSTIYATHGRGGGRKEGAKAIRLADMASVVDADIYIHSHTHLPMILKNVYYKASPNHKSLIPIERTFVNTASCLDYAKYAEKNEFKPNSKSTPVIIIDIERNSNRSKGQPKYIKKTRVTM